MADWVHCNLCFHQPGDGRKFSLTNCGHIYCELCLKEGAGEKCKMCGSACSTIALSAQMKPDVEIFFTDPVDLLQKHRKQLIQVMDFQKNHRRRLNAYVREKLSKQGKVIEISQKNISQFQEMERQILKLKEENVYLKKLISDKGISGGSRPGTPGNRLSSSPGGYRASPGNMSHASPTYRSSGNTPSSQRHTERHYPVESSHSTPHKPVQHQQMVSSTPPSSLSRVSVRTPPSNGRIGCIPRTPSPRETPQPKSASIRGSTPGAGEALRHSSPGIALRSPVPMNMGTPHSFQSLSTPGSRHSTMSEYRQAMNTVSPGFTIHTPRGADTLMT